MRVFLIAILFITITVWMLLTLPFGGLIDASLIEASISATIMRFPLALAALAITLRTLDYVAAIKFTDDWAGLTNAHAIYFGARIVGVCLLLAAIFG